jgi:hypothetical protein
VHVLQGLDNQPGQPADAAVQAPGSSAANMGAGQQEQQHGWQGQQQ